MPESGADSTRSLDLYGAVGVQTVHEALEDSMCLQALTRSLLDRLQSKYDELQQPSLAPSGDVASEKEVTKRNIENLMFAIENIRTDIDANIETFNNPHSKTFFQSNIEQLTAIYQLLFILPSLRPFIPDMSPNVAIPDIQPTITLPSNGIKNESDEGTDSKDTAPACFDRVPRSLSSVPLETRNKSELKKASQLAFNTGLQ